MWQKARARRAWNGLYGDDLAYSDLPDEVLAAPGYIGAGGSGLVQDINRAQIWGWSKRATESLDAFRSEPGRYEVIPLVIIPKDRIKKATVTSRIADRYLARINETERDRCVRRTMVEDLAHFLLKEATFTHRPYDAERDLGWMDPTQCEYRYTVAIIGPPETKP